MKYLRVKDVEKIIDRDRNTILRWEREGKIPHPQKDSRGWRFYTDQDLKVILDFVGSRNWSGGLSINFLKSETE